MSWVSMDTYSTSGRLFDDFAFDHIFSTGLTLTASGTTGGCARCTGLFVHACTDLLNAALQVFNGGTHIVRVTAVLSLAHRFNLLLDARLETGVDLIGIVSQSLFGTVDARICQIVDLDFGFALFIRSTVALSVLDHLVDFFLAQPARRGNRDVLGTTSRLICCRNVEDTIRVDVE